MVSVAEVVVEAVPDGLSETTGDLEQMEQTVNDSTESMSEQADEMSGLAESFDGAMSAAVAGLAVGAAGLAQQVPVIGELFAGFGAILDAVGFQIDSLLRQLGVGGLTGGLFDISTAIFEAEGAVGDFVGVVGSLIGTAGAAIAGFASWKVASLGLVAGLKATGAGIASVLGSIASLIAGIVSLPAVIAGAIAALAAFTVAYLTNWRGVRDKTDAIVGEIISFVTNGFTTLANGALEILTDFVGFAIDRFMAFLDFLSDFGADIATAATGIGANIVNGIIEGIKGLTGILLGVITSVINSVIGLINNAIEVIPDTVKENLGLEQLDTISTSDFNAPSITQQQAQSRTNTQPFDFIGSRATSEGNTYIDGRRVNDNQGRYRKDALNRRG